MAFTQALAAGAGAEELREFFLEAETSQLAVIKGPILGWRFADVFFGGGQRDDRDVILEIHDASYGYLADWSRYKITIRHAKKHWRIVSISSFTEQYYGLDESVCGGRLDWQTPSQATPEAAVCTYCWSVFDHRPELAREVVAPGAYLRTARLAELEGCAQTVLAPRPPEWFTQSLRGLDSSTDQADVMLEAYGHEYQESYVVSLQRQDYRWRIISIRPAGEGAETTRENRAAMPTP